MSDPFESLKDTIRAIVQQEIRAALASAPQPANGGRKKRGNPNSMLKTVEESAELLGLSRQTVQRMISEGTLPAVCLRSGRRKKTWGIRKEALERWLQGREREGQRSAGF